MNEQYAAAFDVLARKLADLGLAGGPDRVINGREGLAGDEAEEVVEAVARAVDLPTERLQQHFPFSAYFEPELPLLYAPIIYIRRLLPGGKDRQEPVPLTGAGLVELLLSIKEGTNK